uniref:H(+)-transporting two-sector ATPase n=1 Tax=Histiona aroides TaxID=392300 RepID=M4QKS1_HISAR|nr:ATP synthase F0 subunit 8 [Histiona aroides]AGH24063.1 ATP synthase F0 subunit 8 [Histiona aroides]
MPQLDKVTFFSQYFWLVIFFLTFYFFVLKIALPTIVTIFKVRKRKIQLMATEVTNLKKEESSILSNYDAVLVDSFNTSREVFNSVISTSNAWIQDSSRQINKTDLLDVNEKYLNTINDINKEYIAFNKIKSLL